MGGEGKLTGFGFYTQQFTYYFSLGVDPIDGQMSVRFGQQVSVAVSGFWEVGVDVGLGWPELEAGGGGGVALPTGTPFVSAGLQRDVVNSQWLVTGGIAANADVFGEVGVYYTYTDDERAWSAHSLPVGTVAGSFDENFWDPVFLTGIPSGYETSGLDAIGDEWLMEQIMLGLVPREIVSRSFANSPSLAVPSLDVGAAFDPILASLAPRLGDYSGADTPAGVVVTSRPDLVELAKETRGSASSSSDSHYSLDEWDPYGDSASNGVTSSGAMSVTPNISGGSASVPSWTNNNTTYSPVDSHVGNIATSVGSPTLSDVGWPVLLDIDGDGVEVTELSSSDVFVDMAGDGKLHRTAWAGAGDGVLVRDAGNDGIINLRNEIDFTQWDPTAEGDMQALLNVFDTNHDSKLSAADTDWALFKVMVTNPDGTTTLKTLADLGITEINLISNNQEVTLPDGSKILGTTTYTKSDGSTGTAADTKLAYEVGGYVVAKSVAHNADGSTTIISRASNPDGSLAHQTTVTTSADGKSRTANFDSDGDGVLDRVQTDVAVVNGDGSVTRTIQDYDGSGTILASREVRVTSADGQTVTVSRDLDGSGNYDEVEVRVTGTDGSQTVTITHLNANGSTRDERTTITTADGHGKTIQVELTGNGTINATRAEATSVAGDGTRTETVTNYAGSGTALANKVGQQVSVTSVDGGSKSIANDLDGNGTIDLTSASSIARNLDGSTTITETNTNGDSSLRGRTVTDLSADGLSKSTRVDLDGNGSYDVTVTDVTVLNVDGSTTETITRKASSGATLSQTVASWSADGKSRTTSTDSDGDGAFDRVETVATVSGNSVTTASRYSANGSTLLGRTVSTTSSDGLARTVQVDANGDGTFDTSANSVVAINGDGSSTVTTLSKNGAGTVQIGKTVVTTSADGLSATTQSYLGTQTSAYRTVTDVTVRNGNGSLTETMTTYEGTNQVQTGRTVTDISADRLTTTVKSYLNGNALPELITSTVTSADGSKTQTTLHYSPNGATLLGKSVAVISADGLATTTTEDFDGNATTDRTAVSVTTLNSDGTTTTTTTKYEGSGTATTNRVGQVVVNVSANGLSTTTQVDSNGDGSYDAKTTSVTSLNADGSKTQTVTSYNGAGTVQTGKVVTSVSDDGLTTTRSTYLGNHTIADTVETTVVALNTDGSRTTTSSIHNASGVLISRTVATTAGSGLSATVAADLDGNGINDSVVSSVTNADGSVTTTSSEYTGSGELASRTTKTVSGNGLSTSISSDVGGNGTIENTQSDVVVFNADGSSTRTTSYSGNIKFPSQKGLNETSVATRSADGLSISTQWTSDGDPLGSRTDVTSVASDGTQTRVVSTFEADASLHDRVTYVTSADNRTSTTTKDINGDGTVDQTVIKTILADGSVLTSSMDGAVQSASGRLYGSVRGSYETISADGLSRTVRFDANGNGLAESQTTEVVTLNADGSRVLTVTNSTLSGGTASSAAPVYTATLKERAVTTTSADGLSITTQYDLTGSGSFGSSRSDVTVLNADGSRTETVSYFVGAVLKSRYAVTTSADGLTVTKQWDATGSGSFTETSTDVRVVNGDGSTTETVVNTGAGGVLLSKVVTTTSADGRATTIQKDLDGVGGFEETQTTTRRTLADGTTVVSVAIFDQLGVLRESTTTTSSPDGRIVEIVRDGNGAERGDQEETIVISVDGTVHREVKDATGKLTTTTSADGLSVTSENEISGNDRLTYRTNFINADGSSGTTLQIYEELSGADKLLQTVSTLISADGNTVVSTVDVDGNGTVDETSTTVTKVDGSTVTTITDNAAARAVAPSAGDIVWSSAIVSTDKTTPAAMIITVSADGYSRTVQADYDGNGTYEHTETWTTRIDGSQIGVITDKNSSGVVMASATQTISPDGRTAYLSKDSDNNGTIDHTELLVVAVDGSRTKTVTDYNANGSLKLRDVIHVSANGVQVDHELTGSTANDTLTGGAGNDILDGGTGTDTMIGGSGNDTYYVDVAGDILTETSGGGTDTVMSLVTWTLAANFENLTLLGTSAINATGNSAANVLVGNSANNVLTGGDGNDTLNGKAGNDTMIGGAGDDTYYVDSAGDSVSETGGSGTDTVVSSITFTLATGFENLTLEGTAAINGTGNAANNRLIGNSGANVLTGGDGNDFFIGGKGADTLIGGNGTDTASYENAVFVSGTGVTVNLVNSALNTGEAAGDTLSSIENLIGSDGNDNLTGDGQNNAISGGDGNDTIRGGGGNDTITGGMGADILYGDGGSDLFVFASIEESGYQGRPPDQIMDFSTGDKIDLSAIDAKTGFMAPTGNDAFALAYGSFSMGEIRQTVVGSDLLLEMNVDNYAGADMSILIVGRTTALTNSDFIF